MHPDYTKLRGNIESLINELNKMAPRYHKLKAKDMLSDAERKELGEIEYFLIEISPQLERVKNLINQDLYGMSVDFYYKLKMKAQNGDIDAKKMIDKLRPGLLEAMGKSAYEHWN